MGWLVLTCDFLRWSPVDGWLRVILGASSWCQVPVAWLSPAQTEAEVPDLHQPEPAGCDPLGPVIHPSVKALPLQESLVEATLLAIHLS